MPNYSARVNSLAMEHEDKTQISVNKNDFGSIFHHLFTNSLTAETAIWAVLGHNIAPAISALAAKAAQREPTQIMRLHVFVARASDLMPTANSLSQWEEMAIPLSEIGASNIEGCHTIVSCDGALSLIIHIGKLAAQLAKMSSNSEQRIAHWVISSSSFIDQFSSQILWQMARLSTSHANLLLTESVAESPHKLTFVSIIAHANHCGFSVYQFGSETLQLLGKQADPTDRIGRDIAEKERNALRQQHLQCFNFTPLYPAEYGETAIIGGGVASGCLALSLAERQQDLTLFCMDDALGQQASGNKQGAIYPLLTPEHGTLSHFFLQGFLFSRQRIRTLANQGYKLNHDFCGVLQTGHDERSTKRLDKIISSQPWANNIAQAVSADEATRLAGIEIGIAGIYYPLGGWVCPQELTAAAIEQAASLSQIKQHYKTQITHIERIDGQWYLTALQQGKTQQFGPFANVVLANGRHLTDFVQTSQLPISGFRGQVSHLPSRGELAHLKTVLCSHGYLTPAQDALHCTGASYIKDPNNLDYSVIEQLDNLNKIRTSYHASWVDDVDITGHSARVGVRMVTRDHAPMMGCAPDFDVISKIYQTQQPNKESAKYWQTNKAPVHDGLFVLGGLGSRGLTSGPLAAEILAAQMCGELLPATMDVLSLLNPNRMWMRKLIKGKALT